MEETRLAHEFNTIKRKLFSFPINSKFYTVYEVDRIKGKKTYVGETDYIDRTVKIESGSAKQMRLTLIHELMHIWLYENGHIKQDNGCFSYEDLCEYTALAYNFISEVMNFFDKEFVRR